MTAIDPASYLPAVLFLSQGARGAGGGRADYLWTLMWQTPLIYWEDTTDRMNRPINTLTIKITQRRPLCWDQTNKTVFGKQLHFFKVLSKKIRREKLWGCSLCYFVICFFLHGRYPVLFHLNVFQIFCLFWDKSENQALTAFMPSKYMKVI